MVVFEKCVLSLFFGVGFVLGLVDVWVRPDSSGFVLVRRGRFGGGVIRCR